MELSWSLDCKIMYLQTMLFVAQGVDEHVICKRVVRPYSQAFVVVLDSRV